jgi:hypothetical protein
MNREHPELVHAIPSHMCSLTLPLSSPTLSPSPPFSQDQEVFVDTINTPTIRKKLLNLSAQDPGESRRRWHHVTEALLNKDIEEATDAKHALEEKQRADARSRQARGVEWKQEYFHLEGDMWRYNTPLASRMRTARKT